MPEQKEWDGVTERRCQMMNEDGSYCSAHIKMIEDVTAIKTILKNIESGIASNRNIIVANIGVIVVLITQIIIFSYLYGGLAKQVEINTQRWERLMAREEQNAANNLHILSGSHDDRMPKLQ